MDCSAGVINNANHVPGNTCVNVNYVVPGASVPTASNVKVRWNCVFGTSGDYYVYLDNISITQPTTTPPVCTVLTSPINEALNVSNTTITWAGASGIPTGYYLNVGYSTGDTSVFNLQDVGNVLSYPIPTDPGTTYYVTVIPYNAFGQATGCTEISFTTCDALLAPFLEQFTTFLPSCWQAADNGSLLTGPATFGTSSWAADGFGNVGSTGAIKINIDSTGDNDWIISPVVNIPASGYELKFDAAATQWSASTAPTTPWEADDFIQVLISSTGTSNWTVLHTYNNTNQPTNTGTPLVLDLDAYAGQEVRFAIRAVEGAVNGSADIDFSIDNFEVRLTPALPPACATNVVATPNATCGNFANTITWDATSGADGYYIKIGTTTGGSQVANNLNLGNTITYSFTGSIGTTYYYTVLPYNAAGPATGCTEMSFTTNTNGCYCVSAPTSVDSDGITNVQIGTTNFANTVTTSPVYSDNTATPVDMSRGITNNVQISFNVASFSGSYDYSTVIWIDANDNYTFEASEIVFTGMSPTTAAPTALNASFVLPGTMPLGQHRMRIVATDGQQTPSNPCYSGSYGETVDFTINVIAATCVPPAFSTATVVHNCATSQFSVDVNVTSLGGGTPSITDGTSTWPVLAAGVVTAGPFAYGTPVSLTLSHGTDNICNVTIGTYNYTVCPPANDECSAAVGLTVNANYLCGVVTAGTTAGATDSGVEPTLSVSGYPDNDVWYSFVATQTAHRITLTNVVAVIGTDTDMGIGVYNGTCGALTLVGSSDPDTYNLTGLTIGNTYLVNVYGWYELADDGAQATFDICVGTDPTLNSSSFDSNAFMAYPNPVKDVLNLEYTSEISSVRVMNLLGQEVISRNINANATQVDMSHLSAGAYIVNVTVGDAVKTIKVVKQ